ncbi:TPD1 protein homolog 1B-like [Triticum dicoccoides]|uniref:TPD1 protein homolog 1B-like n=1 Tax=Triticum dicoccoides TaxID=85692 RepID=UPI000E7C3BE6|nr:TPD1 protein homolog 1B-like [Triticum dicoccoides]
MACFRIRSSAAAVVVVTMLLLQACFEVSASSSLQQHPHQSRKMLSVDASSVSSSGAGGPSAEPLELEECSEDLLEVFQNNAPSMAGGMPTYSVEFTNTCIDCAVCDVHVACGDFASNDVIDPDKFRRLGFNDCLVNGGRSIEPSFPVSFQYGNSFPYPMTVASASCDYN